MGINVTYSENTHVVQTINHKARWYGKLNPQTATKWCDGATLNPYVVASGNNDWGAGEQMFGADDVLTEIGDNLVAGTMQIFLPITNTSDTTSRMRFVWGTGTMAEGIAANQFMELMYHKLAANAVHAPRQLWGPVMPFFIAGLPVKVWAQHWNATNLATISFFIGVCGYTV